MKTTSSQAAPCPRLSTAPHGGAPRKSKRAGGERLTLDTQLNVTSGTTRAAPRARPCAPGSALIVQTNARRRKIPPVKRGRKSTKICGEATKNTSHEARRETRKNCSHERVSRVSTSATFYLRTRPNHASCRNIIRVDAELCARNRSPRI